MGHLKEVIEQLKKEYIRSKRSNSKKVSHTTLKSIIEKYDLDAIEKRAKMALDEFYDKDIRATQKELLLREEHPGLYDVVFINNHTKEKQVLTRKIGVTYDMAWHYYMYITCFEDDKYNQLGKYELAEHPKKYLPEEEHFGIN